jgi:Tol biopolymer transport system component
MLRRILLFIIQITLLGAQDFYEYNHPELEWRTFETKHFVYHFHQGAERTARIIAQVAEAIYVPLTHLYQYEPDSKIHFVVKDTDDYSNGGAFFFDNKIEILAENLDYIMRGTKNWLRDVVTHEFTHMIQIQKSMKSSRTVPYGFLQIFGYEPEKRRDVVRGFPNVLVSYPLLSINIPVWFAEGVAQHQADGARYDYRDPNREMILRDRVHYNRLLTYNEMGVFGKTSHGNESAYNLGFAFVNYLCDRFGEEVLEKISDESSKWSNITFNKALKKATGLSADSLHTSWKAYLETHYDRRLETILAHEIIGEPVEVEGFANLYPIWSPDGHKIAYLSNKGRSSFYQNQLIIFDRLSGEKKGVTAGITSSLSWSPDGRYLAYSRQMPVLSTGSQFNDLFVYDLQNEEEIRISKRLRGKNPDWSSDGEQLVFVTESNGLNQLMVFTVADLDEPEQWHYYDIENETGRLKASAENKKTHRIIAIRGEELKQLLFFTDGRQIYHPRWAKDNKQIIFDTATDYGRDIGLYDLRDKKFKLLLTGKEELRYPVFHPEENAIIYTSSVTGIYNIYKTNLETNETQLLTNVIGGAMMPQVNSQNQLVYSCYDSLGFHIYALDTLNALNPEWAAYQNNYLSTIPVKNFDDTNPPVVKIQPAKRSFTGVHILPRLLIDYSTFKPGIYLFTSDVLNKTTLLAGGDVNLKGDYDLFGIFEYAHLNPTLFLEAYNMNANIEDTTMYRIGEDYYQTIDMDINFNLTEIDIGAYGRIMDCIDVRFAYIISLYNATLEWFDPDIRNILNLRYRYLNGHAFTLNLKTLPLSYYAPTTAINPTQGRRISLFYAYELNSFLRDFDTSTGIGIEEYDLYRFNRIELDWEEYFANPLFSNHALALRLRAGYIDHSVDDFFYLYGGGLIGMKGYSYYSLGGTRKLIGTVTYRFPLFNHMDWQLAWLYFDKLYMGFFYDFGNAWSDEALNLSKFKRDIGVQLRLETFSNHLFPVRFFFEAAYPLDEVKTDIVTYHEQWRYYFGALFEFDFRERLGGAFSYMKRPFALLK